VIVRSRLAVARAFPTFRRATWAWSLVAIPRRLPNQRPDMRPASQPRLGNH